MIEKTQKELNGLLVIRDGYLNIARNDEVLNDKIRELQSQIQKFKKK